ncbi:uncharacterized protein LOC135207182 isoform X2 [Macrobrachium nipponense]|uniref:uncharacterized protein LOC135207182 isoform X2 n=1 Tax=Macrobrachium nipponense TaxID=159736 RepID=UPI0030C7F9F5
MFRNELVKCVYLLLWISGSNKNLPEACMKGPFRRTITIEEHVVLPCRKTTPLPPGKGENTTWTDKTTYSTVNPRFIDLFVTPKATKVEPPRPGQLDCNKNITLENLSTVYWQTPNYPQIYPEGITCKLRIQFPNHQPRGIAILSMEVPSMIFTTDNELCPGDRLTIERLPDGHIEALCGNLSGRTILVDVSLLRTLTFSTTPHDGGASIGFRVGIKGFLLG